MKIKHIFIKAHFAKNIDASQGADMGPPIASLYGNIFMDTAEQRILNSAPGDSKPILWSRFIDDVFAIWTLCKDN